MKYIIYSQNCLAMDIDAVVAIGTSYAIIKVRNVIDHLATTHAYLPEFSFQKTIYIYIF